MWHVVSVVFRVPTWLARRALNFPDVFAFVIELVAGHLTGTQ